MQVRFELIYKSKISYLKVYLHEKTQVDARFDMTIKQEINKESYGKTWKRRTFKQEEDANYQNNTRCM